MKKLLVYLGSCLILVGVKAQTDQPAKKETTKPAMAKPVTGLPPSNPNDKTRPDVTKAQSQIKSAAVKPAVIRRRPLKMKNG